MSTALETLPARLNGHAPAPSVPEVPIDYEAVLRVMKLDPRAPATQALLLTCQRYELDPVLKHAVLIQGALYVTRDGLLHVAHRSGQLDGIVVEEQAETPTHFTAKVSVYRKDMKYPFTYVGRYPKSGHMGKTYGPEMAIKTGECLSLRRAFNIGLCAREELWDREADEGEHGHAAEVTYEPPPPPPSNDSGHGRLGAYASRADVRAFEDWLRKVCEAAEVRYADALTNAFGEVPDGAAKNFMPTHRLAYHLLKHAKGLGFLNAPDDEHLKIGQVAKILAVWFARDRASVIAEASIYVRVKIAEELARLRGDGDEDEPWDDVPEPGADG